MSSRQVIFQMIIEMLLHLIKLTFIVADDCMLTPEESIRIQNAIGADIIMQLDDVVESTLTGPRVEESTYRYYLSIFSFSITSTFLIKKKKNLFLFTYLKF